MRDRRVALRYAQGLLEAARVEDVVAGVAESYAAVDKAVAASPGLIAFLEGPQVSEDEKRELLDRLFAGRVEPVLLRFFRLLVDKNRIEHLVDIGREFARLAEKAQGYERAVVITAVPLPGDLEFALSERLSRLTGAKIIMEKRVRPEVLGGVSVRIGDEVIDGTLRTQLALLRDHLHKVPVHLE
jgi:F-type H+-transporting ATPase subunit delta